MFIIKVYGEVVKIITLAIKKTRTSCLQIKYFWQRKTIKTERNEKDL